MTCCLVTECMSQTVRGGRIQCVLEKAVRGKNGREHTFILCVMQEIDVHHSTCTVTFLVGVVSCGVGVSYRVY